MSRLKYTPVFVQVILATDHKVQIHNSWEKKLYGYFKKVISQMGHVPICINGVEDHIHLLVSLNNKISMKSFISQIKKSTEYYINEQLKSDKKLKWITGYGLNYHPNSEVYEIIQTIESEKKRHQAMDFRNEYLNLIENKLMTHFIDA